MYRAVDQSGQVIEVFVSNHSDIVSARRFFTAAFGRAHIRGHALVQNLCHGHYELGNKTTPALRLAAAFDDLQAVI